MSTTPCPQNLHRGPCRCGLPSEAEEEADDELVEAAAEDLDRSELDAHACVPAVRQ